MKHTIREVWMGAAIIEMVPLFKEAGAPITKKMLKTINVSCSWPGGGSARKRIGECWDADVTKTGKCEIFISPKLDDPIEVLETVIHEVVHGVVGCKHGHKAPFRRVAVALGLEGKMTATYAGKDLVKKLKAIAKKLGKYPHKKIDLSARKKAGTRLIKAACHDCNYTIRTTMKWIDVAAPICPDRYCPNFEGNMTIG